MTIGEKIQFYRKQQNLSQEDLAQKLLVSRQTISLWENNQTVPTIDNLIRLKEIFGVSVDEILGCEDTSEAQAVKPIEHYEMTYSDEELSLVSRYFKKLFIKVPVTFIIISILLALFMIVTKAPDSLIGFGVGWFFVWSVLWVRSYINYNKNIKKAHKKVVENNYEFIVFEDYFFVNIRNSGELKKSSKIKFDEITQLRDIGNFLLVIVDNQTYIFKKSVLPQNSVFYSIMLNNPKKTLLTTHMQKHSTLLNVLFIASALSIFAPGFIVYLGSGEDIQLMWIFYIFALIPLASLIAGIILKSKKNIIIGVIMTVIFCIFGSFTFIFGESVKQNNEIINKAEAYIDIDIPKYEYIDTIVLDDESEFGENEYDYYITYIDFKANEDRQLNKIIEDDERWLQDIPSPLKAVASSELLFYEGGKYLFYNITTQEYNEPPSSEGMYHFIACYYNEDCRLIITEYDINYVLQ